MATSNTNNRTDGDKIADALREVFITPNESDSNFEAAGPTDGLYHIARALDRIADAIQQYTRRRYGSGDTPKP